MPNLISLCQSLNPNNNVFQYFLFIFFRKTLFLFQLIKYVFDLKITRKLFLSFYFQKQDFENRNKKMLSNIN